MQRLIFNYYCITAVYKKNLSRLFFKVSCILCFHRNVLGVFVYLCFKFGLTHGLFLSKNEVIWKGRTLMSPVKWHLFKYNRKFKFVDKLNKKYSVINRCLFHGNFYQNSIRY